jgi:hypothetical protein
MDEYEAEELRHQYEAAQVAERLRLLETHRGNLPFEVAALAAKDPCAAIRRWFARDGDLDYRDIRQRYNKPVDPSTKDRVFFHSLKADADPLVRASLVNNADFELFEGDLADYFRRANTLERLAIVRDDAVGPRIIENIFDLSSDLDMGFEERKQLALVFLRSRADRDKAMSIEKRASWAARYQPFDVADTTGEEMSKLWTLIGQWPEDMGPFGLQRLFYRYVNANDAAILATYRTCERADWRYEIVNNLHHLNMKLGHGEKGFSDVWNCEVLKLAIKDDDPAARKLAYERLDFSEARGRFLFALKKVFVALGKAHWRAPWIEKAFVTALKTQDVFAIRGLLSNRSLPWAWRRRIKKLFPELTYDVNKQTVFDVEKWRFPAPPKKGPVKWTEEQKLNYLATWVTRLACLERLREYQWYAGTVGLVLGILSYALSGNLAASLFVTAGAVWIGATVGLLRTGKLQHLPPWVTLREWAQQWAPYRDDDAYADRLVRVTLERDNVEHVGGFVWEDAYLAELRRLDNERASSFEKEEEERRRQAMKRAPL